MKPFTAQTRAPSTLAELTPWITEAALRHGQALPEHLSTRLGITRRRALALLRKLADAQWLTIAGTARKPTYAPGALRQAVRRYPLAGLMEDQPWRRDFAPCMTFPREVERLVRLAFTELVNNAIDHSGGTHVTISLRQTPLQAQLLVSDDGCGLFDRVSTSHGISEPTLAMLELGKGKLTSAPERHLGLGLVTVAQAADVMDLHANAAAFQCRGWDEHRWHTGRAGPVAARAGTTVYVAIALDTPRTVDSLLTTSAGEGMSHRADHARVPLRLLAGTTGELESRAEARRATLRLDAFASAELDFSGIRRIGPAFADELFRVLPQALPALRFQATGMTPDVLDAARQAQQTGAPTT